VSVQTTAADAQNFIDALGRLEAESDPEPLVALFAQDSVCDNVMPTSSFEGPEGDGRITRFKAYFDPNQVGRRAG
jgi:hypothetical protein